MAPNTRGIAKAEESLQKLLTARNIVEAVKADVKEGMRAFPSRASGQLGEVHRALLNADAAISTARNALVVFRQMAERGEQ